MAIPPEIITALLSALPFTEIRASIPIAMGVYHLSAEQAALWSLVGSGLATFAVLKLLGPVVNALSARFNFFKRFFNWIFERTRGRAADKYVKYGQWALVLFVAVPLPGSGFWTGSLIAWLFNIPRARAWWLIFMGLVLSVLLVVLATLGVFSFF
ncbi:MAG TPA: small multi-drug export protein [Patescibacteria group bacterium]|nr:small multi-drug export protein [Patescibacteria group bacterium]